MPGARTTSGTSECWSATSALTRRGTPSSACADTSSVGRVFISGWRRGRAARCVRSARPPSAERRSSPCTAGGTQNRRILEQRCHRGRPVSARSRRVGAGSRASASARASTCHSASAPSPSASSHPPSTLATHGLAQRRAARRSTRRNSSCRRYSCGWPSCSCCGSSSRDRPGWWAGGRCARTARETSSPTCWPVDRRAAGRSTS